MGLNSKNTAKETESNIQFEEYSVATFAGGCFWCTEAVFQETEGVVEVISGYAGGKEENPTYKEVYTQQTGHKEAVQVYYDPATISYSHLLDIFWKNIDPTDDGGQFGDRGPSYTTAIFYQTNQEKIDAEESKQKLEKSGRFDKPIATEILAFSTFFEAEEYHQDFYKKSPLRYSTYKNASGRDDYKERVWQEILKEQKNH